MKSDKIEAKLYLFALKKNDDENAVFSHLKLGQSVDMVFGSFDDDLKYLVEGSTETEKKQIDNILSYMYDCSLWCLGAVDFVSGALIPNLEYHGVLKDSLTIFTNFGGVEDVE